MLDGIQVRVNVVIVMRNEYTTNSNKTNSGAAEVVHLPGVPNDVVSLCIRRPLSLLGDSLL